MLLRVGVSNHLSIRDSQELLFTTSSLKDRKEGLIDCPVAPRGSVLPAIVIYGANASGKSNLVHALATMRDMVLHSHPQGDPAGVGLPNHAFRLDPAFFRKPSCFDIDFVLGGVRHHYGFEATNTAFVAEWLYAFPKSYRRILFERDAKGFRFGRELRGQNSVIAKLTRPNSLYLSAAAHNSHEQLSKVFGYLLSLRSVRDVSVAGLEVVAILGDQGLDPRVIDFLARIETGICDFKRKETEFSEESRTAQRAILELVGKLTGVPIPQDTDGKKVTIELAHQSRDGKPVYLELDRESAGTRRLLVVLSRAFRALDEGVPLVIDELDASLHTLASTAVLQLFCSPHTNPKGAQLIATTHDANLMNPSLLRRDQLWFTEKDAGGATLFYPLSDIRTRRGDNFEKGYLQGRYGAVPFDDPISALGTRIGD